MQVSHLDEHSWLVVSIGREDLVLLCGNGGVAGDQRRHDSSSSLKAQGEGSDVEEQQILHLLRGVAGEDGCLQGKGDEAKLLSGNIIVIFHLSCVMTVDICLSSPFQRRAYQQVSQAMPFVPLSVKYFSGRLGAPALTLLFLPG
jgi:hypothetical protein